MADTTTIEWADRTWSPWEGCTKVSPGCDNCYAEAMNRWLQAGENWGPGAPRRIYSEDHWDKPVKWQRAALKFETLHGRRQRVFPSVCDPFDNEAPPILRTRLWGLIRMTPAIDWLLLTKRIGNARDMLPSDWGDGYPNVWLGATVVNQAEADRDIPKLLAVPARVRFLSIEPMLGPVDLTNVAPPFVEGREWHGIDVLTPHNRSLRPCLDWVIAGGESGPHARPMHPDWARSLRDQCAAAGVPYMFKQWGEWLSTRDLHGDDAGDLMERHDKGSRWIEPDGLEHPGVDATEAMNVMLKVGKKRAGRLLDGITHDGFPA
jgi:protein gp37